MSGRNVRKALGDTGLPPAEAGSDEEYEPLYAKASPSKYKYSELDVGSHSDNEPEPTEPVVVENAPSTGAIKKKKKKKNNKKNKKKSKAERSKESEIDEIDRCVMEVNALLGTPEVPPPAPAKPPKDRGQEILNVHQTHLNADNELNRTFGPVEDLRIRRGRQHNLHVLKKAVIIPMAENAVIHSGGLSMSLLRTDGDRRYFIYDHSRDYRRMQSAFLKIYDTVELDTEKNTHVERLLHVADSLFRFEEYTAANKVVERVVGYLQRLAHPSFSLIGNNTRLEYIYLENRPFHIALLKYLHLLTNKACHRTALELAKLMLNLDPSDPLAVLLIIDTLALRAREYEWFIDAVDHWSKERLAGLLFNIQYSHAMAHFHLAAKNRTGTEAADKLLCGAMLRFPGLVNKILDCVSVRNPRISTCVLFGKLPKKTTPKDVDELMLVYAKLTFGRWREPRVLQWFLDNALTLVEKYEHNPHMRESARLIAQVQRGMFQCLPREMMRHLAIIRPMSKLLMDDYIVEAPDVRAWDPLPPPYGGINRYGYERRRLPQGPIPAPTGGDSVLIDFMSSVLPTYQEPMRPPPGLERARRGGRAAASGNRFTDEVGVVVLTPANNFYWKLAAFNDIINRVIESPDDYLELKNFLPYPTPGLETPTEASDPEAGTSNASGEQSDGSESDDGLP